MCDGQQPGRHEWVSTMCALRKIDGADENGWSPQRDAGIRARTFRRIHSPTRGAHCRPLNPRLASLHSGVVMILKNPKIRALTQRRLWVSPFLSPIIGIWSHWQYRPTEGGWGSGVACETHFGGVVVLT